MEEKLSAAQEQEPAPRPVPTNEDGSPMTRLQMKEACRLAFCSGRARLTDLCVKYQLPYDTITRWSKEGAWGVTRNEVATTSDKGTAMALANWVTEQREQQIRRSIGRAGRLQGKVDELLDSASTLSAKDLQSLATAEERTDLICRRNLGMDDGATRGPLVNVNALGSVEIAG